MARQSESLPTLVLDSRDFCRVSVVRLAIPLSSPDTQLFFLFLLIIYYTIAERSPLSHEAQPIKLNPSLVLRHVVSQSVNVQNEMKEKQGKSKVSV